MSFPPQRVSDTESKIPDLQIYPKRPNIVAGNQVASDRPVSNAVTHELALPHTRRIDQAMCTVVEMQLNLDLPEKCALQSAQLLFAVLAAGLKAHRALLPLSQRLQSGRAYRHMVAKRQLPVRRARATQNGRWRTPRQENDTRPWRIKSTKLFSSNRRQVDSPIGLKGLASRALWTSKRTGVAAKRACKRHEWRR